MLSKICLSICLIAFVKIIYDSVAIFKMKRKINKVLTEIEKIVGNKPE